ncbi:MAG: adenylate/guanylate cyclase domain-containing protein, partial [Desulfobacterales bacterium]|nr:adenylate/guanylate cyclase domain-containing protein [Desulfobacterales bacterium]
MIKKLKFFITINSFSLTLYSILMLLVLFMMGVPILDLIELKTYDLRFVMRGHKKPANAVVMAVIDERSLDEEGRWPWPRSKIADLIDILNQEGAKVIGFDIGFLEPDENSNLKLIDQFENQISALNIKNNKLSDFIKMGKAKADNDMALAKSIKNSSADVILGYFFHTSKAGLGYEIPFDEIDRRLSQIEPSKYPLVIFEDQKLEDSPFLRAYVPEGNLDIFTRATKSSGYFNTTPDRDGVLRWAPLIIQCGENIFPPLPMQCVWHYLNKPQLMVNVVIYGVEGIQMGKQFIPTDEYGRILINYLGPPQTFPYFSITDILHKTFQKGAFKDKIVLVGSTAEGIYDSRNTPFSTIHPGLEVHANIIDNILTGDYLKIPKKANVYNLISIIIIGSLIGFVIPRLNALKGAIFAVTIFSAFILTACWLFMYFGVWLNMVYPLLALLSIYISLTIYHYFTEEKKRKEIRSAFSRYAPSNVVDEISHNPDKLKLGGEEREISVLFCDLAGFTGYSEIYKPNAMIEILSEYFNEMTEQVFAFKGLLKEYVGDELMAIFGAPLEQKDHAKRACLAALAMRDRLRALRPIWESMNRPSLRARTGVNSGIMLVGNVGSKYR